MIDTPDWFQSERSPEEVKAQISSCVSLSAPGPHVFLLCVPVDRPTVCELPALKALEGTFGPETVRRHTIVLFTRSDLLPKGSSGVEDYISSQRPEMLELVQRCGDRYHILTTGRKNMKELLEKVKQTVKESGGSFYNISLYQENQENQMKSVRRVRQNQSPSSLDAVRETEEEEEEVTEKSIRLDSSAPDRSLLRSVWETTRSGASRVPKLLFAGALTGAALGLFLAGAVGGAVGATLGSVATEVGRRRFLKQKTE